MNTIDLFSGCGGLSLGFKKAGFQSIFATDIDENCLLTFTKNFPGVPFLCKDIVLITKSEIDALICGKQVDVITGGPPCQGFSLANKRRSNLNTDPRNKLFLYYINILKWYKPKAFVLENVKGLLSMLGGQVIKDIVYMFTNCGYNVEYKVLKASDYGVPQDRERVIVMGIRNDLGIKPEFPLPTCTQHITVDQAISDLPQINAGEGKEIQPYTLQTENDYQKLMRENSQMVYNHVAMKHTKRIIERFKAIKTGESLIDVWEEYGAVRRGNPKEKSNIKFSQNNFRVYGDRPSPTIAASFQSNFIHPYLNRNFTAREGARLQSFPDEFIFCGVRTKMSWERGLSQYQQIGNAVPPLLAFAIAKQLKKILSNN